MIHPNPNEPGKAGDPLEVLFRHSAPRARPPSHAEEAALAALHAQWRQMTSRRKSRRLHWSLAAAASVAVAVGLAAMLMRSPEAVRAPVTVAKVETLVGTVARDADGGGSPGPLAESAALQTGAAIATGAASGLGLRWRDGSSVRLDQNTRVRLTADGEIRIESGRLYVDADDSANVVPLVILTPAGRVRHLGTQYMTDVSANGTTVSVRRGRVRLDGPLEHAEADAGEQLQVDSTGTTRRRAIPGYGQMWEWTQTTAPAFEAEGRSVADFLVWVSRESGRDVTFDSPAAERLAQEAGLRGDIELEPMTALDVVLQTSDLSYEIRGGSIHIRSAAGR